MMYIFLSALISDYVHLEQRVENNGMWGLSCLPGHDVITSKYGEAEMTLYSIWLDLCEGRRQAELLYLF